MERGAFFQFCRFLVVLKRLNLLISLLSIQESKDKIKDGGQNNIYIVIPLKTNCSLFGNCLDLLSWEMRALKRLLSH